VTGCVASTVKDSVWKQEECHCTRVGRLADMLECRTAYGAIVVRASCSMPFMESALGGAVHLICHLTAASVVQVLVAGFFVTNIPAWIGWLRYVSFIYYCYSLLIKVRLRSFSPGTTITRAVLYSRVCSRRPLSVRELGLTQELTHRPSPPNHGS